MYCPRCSQQQISEVTRFCSRCGFLMTGVSELLANGGNLPQRTTQNPEKPSPRKKGLKRGGVMLILGTLIVPLLGVIDAPDGLIGAMAIIFFLGGILRMIYAGLFQASLPQENSFANTVVQTAQKILPSSQSKNALSADQSIPADFYTPANPGNWRETNDLTPHSVTDNTTQLLKKTEN